MDVKNFIFIPILLAAFAFHAYNVNRLLAYLKLAQAENRFGEIGKRVKQAISVALFQTRILRDKTAGPIHAGIFWGFLILLASAVEAILEGISHHLHLNWMGPVYSVITILTDLFCALIILATVAALWRRYVSRVKRLQGDKSEAREAGLILLTIFSIVTSLLIQNTARISMGVDFSWAVRPVGELLAGLISADAAPLVFEICWWIHIVLILGFMNYLPYSKHLHVLTSVPNVYLGPLSPPNKLKAMDFEDEDAEKFGVVDIEDFTWKTLLDGYTCTHCGRCTSVCPANTTGKVLDPRAIIVQINERTMDRAPELLAAKTNGNGKAESEESTEEVALASDEKSLIGDYVSKEALWQCTTCGACMRECPVMIEHVPAIVDMRRSLVMMEADFPAEAQVALDNLENNATPWAFAASERADWAEDMDIKTVAEDQDLDVLFWVGCAGSYDERAKKTSRAFAELMQIAGINFRILGTEEQCTGDPARRIGNEYLADMLIKTNVETLNNYNIKKVVTTCPHCYNTLKNEYPELGGNYDVIHHTQYIRELSESGKLQYAPDAVTRDAVAYHDSCYLGRYNEEYDAPRDTLLKVPGLEILEAERNKDKGFCCGAGGGRMFMEETEGERVNEVRTAELLDTGAETIAVNCPFCMQMMSDGVKSQDKAETIAVKDVAEIVLESVKRNN